jgi:Fanconi anemia group M protein
LIFTKVAFASLYAEIMKLRHAISLVESQGSETLKRYLEKLAAEGTSSGSSRASKHLVRDPLFSQLLTSSRDWKEEHHPKLGITLSIIKAQLSAYPTSRSIIFATYRDTVQLITDSLRMQGVAAERFIGQATKDSDRGFSQKKQIEILNRFRSGEIKVLVATLLVKRDSMFQRPTLLYSTKQFHRKFEAFREREGREGAVLGRL